MEQLKDTIQHGVLTLPDFDRRFYLDTDACNYGIGAALSQIQDGVEKPVSFFSRGLSKPERNYSTSEKELLAIYMAVNHFKYYQYEKEFTVRTDHHLLRALMTKEHTALRLR